ncbi:hypothetical protein TrVE_jg3122 [Triparma verrucosa]|uniref:Uncharacterized protein n=1 Tax=Triparma verrucosa TaxID=1606542 RepID=A0A9W7KV04_9STRA|nr:hypothetical protein TrVE_jg3122 [Triparma verrucosa]
MSAPFSAFNDTDSESENDDWIYEQQTVPSVAGALTLQKISQKEKSIYEMIDVLNTRLASLNFTVGEQQELCAEDINPNSELFSKNLKEASDVLEDDVAGASAKRRQSVIFKEAVAGTGSMEDEAKRLRERFGIPDPATLTWRNPNLPQTDAGRKLESMFAADLLSDNRLKGKGGSRNLHSKKNLESRKEARKEMERRLWAYSENHSGRSATNLLYKLPPDIQDDLIGQAQAVEGGGNTNTFSAPNTTTNNNTSAIMSMTQTQASNVRFDQQANKGADPFLEGARADWDWPIKLGGSDMNPKLLLSLACEKMVLQAGGEQTLKKLCTNKLSCNLFVYFFWFVHCRFFQINSDVEQLYLLSKVATVYTQLLSTKQLEANKDFFFVHYPFVLGQSIILGFKYLCPGNQSLFQYDFKKILYLNCARLLSGVDVCPGSVSQFRYAMYPDDRVETEGEGNGNTLPTIQLSGANKADEDANNMMAMGGMGGVLTGDDNLGATAQHNMSSLLFGGGNAPDNIDGDKGGGREKKDQEKDSVDMLLSQDFPKYQYRRGEMGAEDVILTQKLADENERTTSRLKNSVSMPDFDHAEFPPVQKFTGTRDTLRFRPEKPAFLGKKQLPRQQQKNFDASSISPLLQQYLDLHSNTGGRRPQQLQRTEPVKWCRTGGVDTHIKLPSRTHLHDKFMSDYKKAKRGKIMEVTKSRHTMIEDIRHLEEERTHVLRGGSTSIGKTAIDVMKSIQGRAGGGRNVGKEPQGGIPKPERKSEAVEASVFRRLPLRGTVSE